MKKYIAPTSWVIPVPAVSIVAIAAIYPATDSICRPIACMSNEGPGY